MLLQPHNVANFDKKFFLHLRASMCFVRTWNISLSTVHFYLTEQRNIPLSIITDAFKLLHRSASSALKFGSFGCHSAAISIVRLVLYQQL